MTETDLIDMFTEAESVSEAGITNITFRLSEITATLKETEYADADFKADLEIDRESDTGNSENVVESILNELADIYNDMENDFRYIQPTTLECTSV